MRWRLPLAPRSVPPTAPVLRPSACLLILAALSAIAPARAQSGTNPSFWLLNRAGAAINSAYASPSANTNWGPDRMGGTPLPAQAAYPIRLPADGACVYDLRVVYANGNSEEKRSVDLCGVESVVFAGPGTSSRGTAQGRTAAPGGGSGQRVANDPSFRLVNRGRSAVQEVYATPQGVQSWGQDRLGDDTVEAGGTRVIRLPQDGACVYDVRVVFADGTKTEKRRVNLCALTDLPVP